MQGLPSVFAAEDVVAGLRGAVAHQKVSILAGDVLGAGPGDGAVVPRVRPQVPAVQTQLPLQRLSKSDCARIRVALLLQSQMQWLEDTVKILKKKTWELGKKLEKICSAFSFCSNFAANLSNEPTRAIIIIFF